MSETNMSALSARASQLVDSLAETILGTAETAAEKIRLATAVARVEQRMSAMGDVLDLIDAQRQPLIKRLETATGAVKTLLERQLTLLQEQEVAVLELAQVPAKAARAAVGMAAPVTDRVSTLSPGRGRKNGMLDQTPATVLPDIDF